MSEGKRAIRNLILKAQNIPLNDLQTLMVVNEIQYKVMKVRNDTFSKPLAGVFLQCQKRIVIYCIKKFVKESQLNENKHCTGVFIVFKTKHELKCQFYGNIRVCLFSILRFFDELFDVINDNLFLTL